MMPSRLARYATGPAADAPGPAADAPSPPRSNRRPCLWYRCLQWRTGSMFCGPHGAAARRRTLAGTLPPLTELVDMRPSQIAALTVPVAPPPPAAVVQLPPRVRRRRACLWPDCDASANYCTLCPRCKARRRRLILRGDLSDRPLSAEASSALPALWQAYLMRPARRWAAHMVARSDASALDGVCIAVGCDADEQYGRGLCERCYRRARYQGVLLQFPRRIGGGR
jgi:hypothetical protein